MTSEVNQQKTEALKQQGFIGQKTFEGVLWPPFTTQEALDATRNYDIRDDDVWVITYPKSGTHWVCEIVRLIQANGQVNDIDRDQSPTPIEFGSMHGKAPIFKRTLTWKSPRTTMTHVLEHMVPKQIYEGKGKAIFVIRNPKDVAVSLWHFVQPLKYDPAYVEWGSFLQRYNKGEGILPNAPTGAKQIIIAITDLRAGVVQIADFLERPLSDEAIDLVVEHSSLKSMKLFFLTGDGPKPSKSEESKVSSPQKKVGSTNFIRKGIIGSWKTQFTVAQNETFDELYEREMKGSDLTVDFK